MAKKGGGGRRGKSNLSLSLSVRRRRRSVCHIPYTTYTLHVPATFSGLCLLLSSSPGEKEGNRLDEVEVEWYVWYSRPTSLSLSSPL